MGVAGVDHDDTMSAHELAHRLRTVAKLARVDMAEEDGATCVAGRNLKLALKPAELDVPQSEGAWLADHGRPVYRIKEEATVLSSGDGTDGLQIEIAPEEVEAPGLDIVVSRDDEKRDFHPIDGTPHQPILLLAAVLGVVAGQHGKGNATLQVTVCITDECMEVAVVLCSFRGDVEVAEMDKAQDTGLIERDRVAGIGWACLFVPVH